MKCFVLFGDGLGRHLGMNLENLDQEAGQGKLIVADREGEVGEGLM